MKWVKTFKLAVVGILYVVFNPDTCYSQQNHLFFFQGTKCKYYPDPDFKLEWNGGIGKRGMIFRPGTSKCEAPENWDMETLT